MSDIIPVEKIVQKIYIFRDVRVMLDRDIAELYGVETKRINEQVKRNINRFPPDFMFQLDDVEIENLKSQNATSSWGGIRKPPFAFTEHGILMLSNVLNSERAVNTSIQIIRAFAQLRQMLSTYGDLKKKIEDMEKKYDRRFRIVFDAIRELVKEDNKPERKIGFDRKKEK